MVKGEQTDVGNDGRCRNAAWGAYTSGGGWWVAGVGDIQVCNAPLRKRRWGLDATERCYYYKWILMEGGGRIRRESRNIQKRLRQVSWEGLE